LAAFSDGKGKKGHPCLELVQVITAFIKTMPKHTNKACSAPLQVEHAKT